MRSNVMRRWLAIGTGVGIEVDGANLNITLAQARPSGPRVLGSLTVPGFRDRAAAEWGAEYGAFLKQHGCAHLPAAVILPRAEVIARVLNLPGVPDRDLASAVQFQVDALHPYGDDGAAYAWTRLGSSGAVLIAIIRKELLDRYVALFTEAGVKVSHFTFSGGALYPALRLFWDPPASGFLALAPAGDAVEAYGESPAKPLFSGTFHAPEERVRALAAAELRLDDGAPVAALGETLPAPRRAPAEFDLAGHALPYAAALASACPRLARAVNLLPAQYRSSASRVRYAVTGFSAALLLLALAALAAVRPIGDRRYMRALASEIARIEPSARQALALDRSIETTRARTRVLDEARRRTKADLDALLDVTHRVRPPGWLQVFDLTRTTVTISGQTDQAGALLKILDESPLFQDSEFTNPLSRAGNQEGFRIRAQREGAPR